MTCFKTNAMRYLTAIGLGFLLPTIAVLLGPTNYFSQWLAWVPVIYLPRIIGNDWVRVYIYWILLIPILAGIYTWNKRFFIAALILVIVIHAAVLIVMNNVSLI